MSFDYATLNNGLRVVHERRKSPVAHVGLFIEVGSKDHYKGFSGMAHMIEHTIFKGTTKRKAYHILNRMDNIGGEINAFTTKEETAIHASFLKEYLNRAVDLILDIALNPTFPEKEITREKLVILDEYHSSQENPAERLFDDFDSRLFHGHPLASTILGEPKDIKKVGRNEVIAQHRKYYQPQNMVIASVGDYTIKEMISKIEEFGPIPGGKQPPRIVPPITHNRFNVTASNGMQQCHFIIGNQAYDRSHPKRRTAILMNNILGGPSLNNRLNMNISERHGYAYHLESHYTSYSDSGELSIYGNTDPKYLSKAMGLVFIELKKLRTKALGVIQLKNAHQQLKGHIALSYENGANTMLAMGKSMLTKGFVESIPDIYKAIEKNFCKRYPRCGK
jgi:predicted Zn-dependent peptidase